MVAKTQKQLKRIKLFRPVKDFILISAGVLSACLGLKGFLLPNNFIDGGVTGISLLLVQITHLPLSLLILVTNIPFILMGYYQINKSLALKTIFAISGLSLALLIIPIPEITHDKLLTAVFGGFCLGAGIGFSIRGGCVIDGTEILALFVSRKISATVGDIILIINILIFSVAAFLFGIEIAFYSILTYFAASRTVDFIIEGFEEYTGVTIISDQCQEIRNAIIEKLGRGVTIYSGKSGYGKRGKVDHEIDIIFTVVTRLEVSRLKYEIDKIDENAFVVQHSIKDTKGGMIKKRRLQ